MDTSTHFVTGVSIAGLAHIDPLIATNPSIAQIVLIGTIIGSQAPDFDGISRFFGTAAYVRHHRGINHSLPAIFIWSLIISSVIYYFNKALPFFHLWFWVLFAILLHVFLDVLNTYGTQALRPFTEKWIALNFLNIFDPFIFLLHSIGIIIWTLDWFNTSTLFSIIYLLTSIYLIWRVWSKKYLIKFIKERYNLRGRIIVMPTIYWHVWNVIEENNGEFQIGVIRGKVLTWTDKKIKKPSSEQINSAKKDKKVQALLYFTDWTYPEVKITSYGYEVRWIDLRYRFQNHYPFNVIVLLNHNNAVIDSYIGWIYNNKFLSKKINTLLEQNSL